MTAYLIRRAVTSLVILIGISIFVFGIYQAARRNTFGDQAVTALAFTTYAMPDFFLYLIAIQVFAISLPIFGFEASQSTSIPHGDRRLARYDAAYLLHRPARAGGLLEVHAVVGDGHPGPGLHQDGAGEGIVGATGAVPAPAP
jgi:ABC-type dipeptide/oligopeptide/nickel transport system permease component